MTLQTIDQAKALLADATKAITPTSPGLTGYSLEVPAKKLYPVLCPLRNRIARVSHKGMGATATNWKAITGINTARLKVSVPFGSKNTDVSYGSSSKTASFKSFGHNDTVLQESQYMGRNFEDVLAFSRMACLQNVMIGEEDLILGGMDSAAGAAFTTVGLGTPGSAVGGTGTGGSVSNGTYSIRVFALPYYGATISSLGTGSGNMPYHSPISPKSAALVLTTGTNILTGTVAPVAGAAAYAWFVEAGTTGSAGKLEAITFKNSVRFGDYADLIGTNLGYGTVTTPTVDTCGDSDDYDGILSQVWGGSSLTQVKVLTNGILYYSGASAPVIVMNTGTPGTGTGLTADNLGGITEFDEILLYLWNNVRLGPQRIICNAQEARRITAKIGGSTGLVFRVQLTDGQNNVVGGILVKGYLNKFTGEEIDVEVHPMLPAGTILFETDRLPYPNSEVPSVLEIELLFDYLAQDFAMTTRAWPHGVYGNGVLKHYFPAGWGIITNIADA
jgi:hypothetical protein